VQTNRRKVNEFSQELYPYKLHAAAYRAAFVGVLVPLLVFFTNK
jgi:hypothetical protein